MTKKKATLEAVQDVQPVATVGLKKIVSFGYKYAPPPKDAGGIVVDVRQMFRNPYANRSLRHKTGFDQSVQDEIKKTPAFRTKVRALKALMKSPGISAGYIGCVGGKHRSVFLAELLGSELGVPVEHRDVHRP